MKAARMHRYGGLEVVVVDDVERPVPGSGEVPVRVVAAAVNPVDWKIREGYMTSTLPIEFPYTFGCDVAGTVEEVGEGVILFLDTRICFVAEPSQHTLASSKRIWPSRRPHSGSKRRRPSRLRR